jgi:hypothetical protein
MTSHAKKLRNLLGSVEVTRSPKKKPDFWWELHSLYPIFMFIICSHVIPFLCVHLQILLNKKINKKSSIIKHFVCNVHWF